MLIEYILLMLVIIVRHLKT